jgi:hypothetical protein
MRSTDSAKTAQYSLGAQEYNLIDWATGGLILKRPLQTTFPVRSAGTECD